VFEVLGDRGVGVLSIDIGKLGKPRIANAIQFGL